MHALQSVDANVSLRRYATAHCVHYCFPQLFNSRSLIRVSTFLQVQSDCHLLLAPVLGNNMVDGKIWKFVLCWKGLDSWH